MSEADAGPAQLLRINSGGQAYLSDDSVWRVAPKAEATTTSWLPGANVTVAASQNAIWRFVLTNLDTNESVLVTRSSGQI
jgi:hypothetical protein